MPTIKNYRCMNQKHDTKEKGTFESTYPKCPLCGIDAKDPKFGDLIQRLVQVHFDPPSDIPGYGKGIRACKPEKSIQADEGPMGVPNPWHAGTGNPLAVSCKACEATAEYKAALAKVDDEDAQESNREAVDGRLKKTVQFS